MIFNKTIDLFFDYYLKRFSLQTMSDVDLSFEKYFIHKLKYPYSECKIDTDQTLPDSKLARKLIDNSNQAYYSERFCKEIGLKIFDIHFIFS